MRIAIVDLPATDGDHAITAQNLNSGMVTPCCVIQGQASLRGDIAISGSKNAALPILAATLLTDQPCVLHNVPELTDVANMLEALRLLGAEVTSVGPRSWSICAKDIHTDARNPVVQHLRASVCLLGALLGRKRSASVAMPGGCKLGARPIDLHLRAFHRLGAQIHQPTGYVSLQTDYLMGTVLSMLGPRGPSMTGTSNAIMAAVLAKGTTIIRHASREPEIASLCHMLNQMGARITGLNSGTLIIKGVPFLHGTSFTVPPDRIEAGTFIILGYLRGTPVRVHGLTPQFLTENFQGFFDAIPSARRHSLFRDGVFEVHRIEDLPGLDICTLPYPGFPTDLQPQISVLASQAISASRVRDTVFPQRFAHIPEFRRLGIQAKVEHDTLHLAPHSKLRSGEVTATDLRAGAALYLAGILADGSTTVFRPDYVDRGYEHFEEKLQKLGVELTRLG
ncbi:MAG: UDP-N-acetylglucosamine 1-carboxyvinyltransferase [Verrucomicrobiota bacterium]|nr:MAG: UDP-N-acetylglucosamine 1-carboxyvinyltransferase [Verrucomicrobiota bacterium]